MRNGNERFIEETNVFTRDYFKVNEEQRQCYINKIEEHFGGKLNMETLEIEKAQPEFKPFTYVISNDNDDNEWTLCQFSHIDKKIYDR